MCEFGGYVHVHVAATASLLASAQVFITFGAN